MSTLRYWKFKDGTIIRSYQPVEQLEEWNGEKPEEVALKDWAEWVSEQMSKGHRSGREE